MAHGQSPIGDVEYIDKEHVQENYETVENIYGDVQTYADGIHKNVEQTCDVEIHRNVERT